MTKKKKAITKERLDAYIAAVETWVAELKATSGVLIAADSETPPPPPPPNPPR